MSWGFSLAALWSAIFGMASVYLSHLLRDSDKSTDQLKPPGTLELAITGELPLWKAFWLLYIALPYALGISTQGMMWALKHYQITETAQSADLLLTPLTLAAVQTAWLWAAIVTWRCASNTGHRAWVSGTNICPYPDSAAHVYFNGVSHPFRFALRAITIERIQRG